MPMLSEVKPTVAETMTLENFLASVERRAYGMALVSTRNEADALDIVQDAMMSLVQSYSERQAIEWPKLFQRILQHRIIDWHRQGTRWRQLFRWFGGDDVETDESAEAFVDPVVNNPEHLLAVAADLDKVTQALSQLPLRQRQVFMLRAWEGFDVSEAAEVLGCSEGSIKTHYFRALNRLRALLEVEYA